MALSYPAPGHETENMLKKECGNKPYLLIADGLAVKEGKTASPTIQPDYWEIGRWLGEQLRTKKQKIGVIADWKMSEAVQAEICGLNEALEGSESKISWCIYRRKEQDIVERMKKETEADALVILDAGILEEFGEQAENGTYKGAELYGVGYSLKTIALLDNGNIQGLAVPDGLPGLQAWQVRAVRQLWAPGQVPVQRVPQDVVRRVFQLLPSGRGQPWVWATGRSCRGTSAAGFRP